MPGVKIAPLQSMLLSPDGASSLTRAIRSPSVATFRGTGDFVPGTRTFVLVKTCFMTNPPCCDIAVSARRGKPSGPLLPSPLSLLSLIVWVLRYIHYLYFVRGTLRR